MKTLILISSYLFTLVVVFILDMLRIEYVAQKIYKKYLANILKDNIRWLPAVLFYIVFTLSLFVCIVTLTSSWLLALQFGLLFGFIIYSLYSLSNLSFIKDWNYKILFLDILWGTILGGVSGVVAYFITNAML
ncbi:DUF2177 family protein [Patescibacteria group bacterium]|nr:DUF2177 family protein [Patescibacteria group bacterium]